MVAGTHSRVRRALFVALIALTLTLAAGTWSARALAHSPPGVSEPSGGAGLGGLAPVRPSHTLKIPPPPSKHAHGKWLSGVTVTEYWPAPESWFVGKLVSAPGLTTKHRIDWLYSASGVSMQGEGLGLDGQMYHIDSLGNGGWVTENGTPTSPSDGWAGGSPFWRAGAFWRNAMGAVTFPLATGAWFAGKGKHYVALPGVTFALGPSLPLHFYQSIAVDPKVIPLGSRVYIPAYRHDGYGGWFVAQDTGGGIIGHHVDVYRSPPASPSVGGQYLSGERIFVIKPHA